jgi:adenine-specific DNA-methyltransferase
MSTPRNSSRIKCKVTDSFESTSKLKSGSIQLVVTSPPYNIGKSYEKRMPLEEYLRPYEKLASDLHRALTPDGSVCWQVGNYSNKGQLVPLDIPFFKIFTDAGFVLKNRIIWHFRHGMHASKKFSGRYETILWFSKTAHPYFDLDPVRIPSLYPGKRATKGPKKGLPSGNPLGKNPSDFWHDVVLEDWEKSIWDIPNVKAKHVEKTEHPCQFPVELVERCILALSREDDLVFDPFMGVGSTAVGACRLGRRFLGFDMDPEFVSVAQERVKLAKQGLLKVREIGTPIKDPRTSGSLSKIPPEWQ